MILVAVIIAIAAAARIVFLANNAAPPVEAIVTVAGNEVGRLSLAKDRELIVRTTFGGVNRLVVEDGTIRCEEATCPDRVCIHSGRISETGSMIVCMPNEMVVYIGAE